MSNPTNLSDRGAGELHSAARLYGEPLMKANGLTRWFIRTALLFLAVTGGVTAMHELTNLVSQLETVLGGLLVGANLMFIGGIGIRFLPSSLGGSPNVYSLNLALWSYWLILVGTLTWGFGGMISVTTYNKYLVASGGMILMLGSVVLLVNLWKSMERSV